MDKLKEEYIHILNKDLFDKKIKKIRAYQIKTISKAKNVNPETIQSALLSLFGYEDWQVFINSQSFGYCNKIAGYVGLMFPNVKVFEVSENYSNDAVKFLEQNGDTDEKYGNHFINQINGVFYDFAKGTNCILNKYLIGDNSLKYNVTLTESELSCFTEYIERDAETTAMSF